jgi:hypothetical protein
MMRTSKLAPPSKLELLLQLLLLLLLMMMMMLNYDQPIHQWYEHAYVCRGTGTANSS